VNKRLRRPDGNRVRRLWVYSLAAALLCSHAAVAQSGRHRKKAQEPQPPVAIETGTTASVESDPPEPPALASSIILGGTLVHDYDYFRSSYVDDVLKICMERLMERPFVNVSKGGGMTRKEATERAKLERDAYILWMEVVTNAGPLGETYISYVDYLVFAPQTAKVVTYGRSIPIRKVIRVGGGAPLPTGSRGMSPHEQLLVCGQDIADRVRRKLLGKP
jgi:hypothetical protein